MSPREGQGGGDGGVVVGSVVVGSVATTAAAAATVTAAAAVTAAATAAATAGSAATTTMTDSAVAVAEAEAEASASPSWSGTAPPSSPPPPPSPTTNKKKGDHPSPSSKSSTPSPDDGGVGGVGGGDGASPPLSSTTAASPSSSPILLRRQLRLLAALRCLRNSNPSNPVVVPYLSSASGAGPGLTAPEVLWLGSAYSTFVVLAEMPSGWLSDVWGRRNTLRASFFCLGMSLVALAAAGGRSEDSRDVEFEEEASLSSFVVLAASAVRSACHSKWSLLLLSQFLRAVGSALFSGTDMALLFETLRRYRSAVAAGSSESSNNGGTSDGAAAEERRKKGENGVGESSSASSSSSSAADDDRRIVRDRTLSLESRHVFLSAMSESVSSALGGTLSSPSALGMRGTVLVSAAVPFGLGAALCCLLEYDCPRPQRERDGDGAGGVGDGGGGGSEGGTATEKWKVEEEEEDDYDDDDESKDGNDGALSPSIIPPRSSQIGAELSVASSSAAHLRRRARQRQPQRQQQRQRQLHRSPSKTTTTRTNSLEILTRRASSLLVPPPGPLRRLIFPAGVALNCATYVASTALLPLLWSASGLDTGAFGWLGAANRAVSAASALCAPMLTRMVASSSPSKMNRGKGGGEEEEGKDAATGRALEALLLASAASYGIMAASAASVTTTTTTTVTAADSFSSSSFFPSSSSAAIALAVAASLLLSAVRGLAWPLLGSAINGSIEDDSVRASTLSLFAGSIKAGMILTGLVLGTVLKVEGGNNEGVGAVSSVVPGLRDACMICCALTLGVAAFCSRMVAASGRTAHRRGMGLCDVDDIDDDDDDEGRQRKKDR